jgi:thiol-disulfide isomerase/thioredoxin
VRRFIRSLFPAIVATCIVTLAGCDGAQEYKPLRVGDALPEFEARSLAGDTVSLADADMPTLINVWATWCVPCRTEMPALEALHREFEDDGLRVVGINIDAGSGDEPVEAFLADLGITFRNLRDPDDRVTRTFRLVGVPETLLVDANGRLAHRWIGRFDPSSENTKEIVRSVLAKS